MRSAALVVFMAFITAPRAQAEQHSTFPARAQANASTLPGFSAKLTD
jgi:hypothetical protein